MEDKTARSIFGENQGSSEEEIIGADLADRFDAKHKSEVKEAGGDGYEEDNDEAD